MKFLKGFIIAVFFGIALLLLVGVFVPAIDQQVEVRVEKPMMSVFAGMLNAQDLPEWVVDLESVERTGGFLAMPGSTFTLHFKGKETESVYTLEILEVVPMESVRFRMYNDLVDMEANIKLEADGGATDVNAFFRIKGQGLTERSLLPLLKSVIADEIALNFQNFKELQEQ